MVNNPESKLEALITIIDFDLGDDICKLFKKNDMPVFLLTHGYGSAKSVIYDILGYGGPKKIVSISIQSKNRSDYILKQIDHTINLGKPGTGVAFTIRLSSISSTLSRLSEIADEKHKIGSETMASLSKSPYHLVITIVNSGYFEQVMDAAKSAGATGGTMIHARGLGSKEAMKYLGITIQPEKDLVLILTPQDKKLPIMEKIIDAAGPNTESRGICFSLPVNSALGLDSGLENIKKL